ncbi:MAG: hypothetical protein PHG66_06210 [Candidatus Colwellbacteria bacterium]|nr:hypothetical protein [Candidatus Colwellbacteria bacterium]
MDVILGIIGGSLNQVLWVVSTFFWIVIAIFIGRILFTYIKNWWLDRVQDKFVGDIDWVLLELRFPKGNMIFPKAMEQVFASFYQIYSFGIKPEKRWLEGQIEEWISAEMVSSKDGIRFFIRVNKNFRALVESAIFSQYPNAEIVEAESDYIDEFSKDLPNDEYDLLGTDIVLGRDDSYPIKTYPYFFGERKFEEQELDPISILAETMSDLKSDERIWVQVLIRPDGGELKKRSDKVIDKMLGKKEAEKPKGIIGGTTDFARNLAYAPVQSPEWMAAAPKPEEKAKNLNAIESEVMKAVGRKGAKTAFETMIRTIYIDKKDNFTRSNFTAVTSAFQQFNTRDLNYLRPSALTYTKSPRFFFKKSALLRKKKNIFQHYIGRSFSIFSNLEETTPFLNINKQSVPPFLLNIEELATIYHPPIMSVVASGLRSLEAKKGVPPANLPIEE